MQVPRDRLALAVFIRREVELGGVLECGLEILDDGLAAFGQLVGGLEAVVDVDVQTLARQVGHVADRGAHVVVAAEELRQRLGLGGRLDDDEGFGHRCLSQVLRVRRFRVCSLGDGTTRCQGSVERFTERECAKGTRESPSRVPFVHDVERTPRAGPGTRLGGRFRRCVGRTGSARIARSGVSARPRLEHGRALDRRGPGCRRPAAGAQHRCRRRGRRLGDRLRRRRAGRARVGAALGVHPAGVVRRDACGVAHVGGQHRRRLPRARARFAAEPAPPRA